MIDRLNAKIASLRLRNSSGKPAQVGFETDAQQRISLDPPLAQFVDEHR